MKYLILCVSLMFLLVACERVINVAIEKEPGTITGRVLPTGIAAFVEVHTPEETRHVDVDRDGYFAVADLNPGRYNLLIDAPAYGRRELVDVYVGDDEVCDVGVVELNKMPYPIAWTSIYDGQTDVTGGYLNVEFYEGMDMNSVEKGIRFEPALTDTRIYWYGDTEFRIYWQPIMGTEYSVTLDTTVRTRGGQPLEFAYSFSFTMEPFRLEYFGPASMRYRTKYDVDLNPLEFDFNSQVMAADLLANLTIEPPIEVYIPTSVYDYLYLYSSQGWISDTTLQFEISQDLTDINGNRLANDTTVTIDIPPLMVVEVRPYNTQLVSAGLNCVLIRLNNIIDEGTIGDAIRFTPDFEYEIRSDISNGNSILRFVPDSALASDSKYTIEVETSLTDRFGVHLAEKWTSIFYTQ